MGLCDGFGYANVSLRIDKRSAPRLRPELRTRYENDILLLIFVRDPWGRDTSGSGSLRKHQHSHSILSAVLWAVYRHHQTVMRRFKFPVPDKERMSAINRALSVVYCLSPKLCSLFDGVSIGETWITVCAKKSSLKAFLKKMRLIMTWDRKVSKTVRPLLDWQSKISPKYYWAESLFLSVHPRSGHMFNFLTHAGLIHVTYIKSQ